MGINYHYIAHIVSAVVIVWMFSILNNKPKNQTVNKAVYERLKSESIRLLNERDSIAQLVGKSQQRIEELENRKPETEVVYLTRHDEITLLTARAIADSVHDILADERARFQRP